MTRNRDPERHAAIDDSHCLTEQRTLLSFAQSLKSPTTVRDINHVKAAWIPIEQTGPFLDEPAGLQRSKSVPGDTEHASSAFAFIEVGLQGHNQCPARAKSKQLQKKARISTLCA